MVVPGSDRSRPGEDIDIVQGLVAGSAGNIVLGLGAQGAVGPVAEGPSVQEFR